MHGGRGAALLAVAVLLGIVLLNAADNAPPDQVSSGGTTTTTTAVTTPVTEPTTVATLPLRAPAEVKVITANGTAIKGVAGKARDQLKAAGYNVLAPTDAQKAATSAVYSVGDFTREAQVVATNLGVPGAAVLAVPNPGPVADARGASIIVVIGADLAPRYTPSSTATTTAGAVTTTTKVGATTTTTRVGATTTTTKVTSSTSSTSKP